MAGLPRWVLLLWVASGCSVEPHPVECVLPANFDVGDARVGGSVTRPLTVTNPLDVPGEVFLGEAPAPFFIEPSGTLRLAAHESREVVVRFAPLSPGRAEAPWTLAPSADCTATRVELIGLAVEAPLTIAPGRLDFGVLTPGTPRALSVEVQNHTRSELTLRSLSSSSPRFRSLAVMPMQVPAGGVASLVVEALAVDSAPFDGTLVVTTDANELRVPLLANRTAPCLLASPTQLDFTAVEAGCRSHDAQVLVTNTCPHQVALSASAASPGFALISGPPQGAVLAPGAAVTFALAQAPLTSGATSGQFGLSADVLDGTQGLSVPLAGLAIPAVEVEESETIPPTVVLDVVIILDDSVAMAPLAASVAQNLGLFAQWARANDFDARMAVMTTSTAPGELGQLRGSTWLSNPSPAELQALGVVHGTSTARSSCLEAMSSMLSPPLRNELRPGAGLYLLCITNGPDGLEVAPMPLISSVISRLPQPSAIGVVAHFPGTLEACPASVELGPLAALVEQTNGVREEICTPNWSVALERVGRSSFGYRTHFFLHQHPALSRGPIRVWFDDVEIPEVWTYDSLQNSVNFEPLYTPAPGQTVRFRYTPDCPR
jgi:hypothetical protein